MSFQVRCDWCGAIPYEKDHAVLKISISRPGHVRGFSAEERPTLHLCVESLNRDARDRLGLPDFYEDDPTDCYSRAVATIRGKKGERPDMGMEWRLVPIGAKKKPAPAATFDPKDAAIREAAIELLADRRIAEALEREADRRALREQAAEKEAQRAEQREQAYAPGGIGTLSLSPNTMWILIRGGILRVEQLRGRSDDDLLALPGRLAEVRTALDRQARTVSS